jgi:polyphosphate kinase 2 (PPK2 family)
LRERALWPEYKAAYEAVLNRTSTEFAPWFVVPADRKWYRNLVIATTMVDTLKGLNMKYPPAEEGLDDIVIE